MDKEALLNRALPEADVEIDGVGTVRVRGVTRGEYLHAGKAMTGEVKDITLFEKRLLVAGMVDPALTEDEAGRWQRSAGAAEIGTVIDKIQELSGSRTGAPKSGV